MRVGKLVELAIYIPMIIVMEQAMLFLSNISFTPLLLAVYFKNRDTYLSYHLVIIYVILDNFIMSSMSFYLIPMLLGWLAWLFLVKITKTETKLILASTVFASIYGFTFAIFAWVLADIDIIAYLIADIPFQIYMAIGNILTISILFNRLDTIFKMFDRKEKA